jgi:CheY-like chemotaxis protein
MADSACGRDQGHRILVVDDNRAVREALVTLLESRGFDARGVGNGREALAALRAGFDACLILLDLTMPIMDGRKFRDLQRQDAALADIPIVVLSTLSDAKTAAAEMGALAGFAKPLESLDRLVELVGAHCPHEPHKRTARADDRTMARATQVLRGNGSFANAGVRPPLR